MKIINYVVDFIKKNYIWMILFGCLALFILITEDVFEKEMMNIDIIGSKLVSDKFLPIVKVITNFGGLICLSIITIILIIFIKNQKLKLLIPINLISITILNQLFKFILKRPRPTEYVSGYSFPSGHSMVSMAFYGYLIFLIYKNITNKTLKWIMITLLSILIILIGISRIYLNVHYTTDVLAGFLISIVYLILFVKGTERYYIKGGK